MAKDGDQWLLVCLQCEGVTIEVMVKLPYGPTHCKGLNFNGYIISCDPCRALDAKYTGWPFCRRTAPRPLLHTSVWSMSGWLWIIVYQCRSTWYLFLQGFQCFIMFRAPCKMVCPYMWVAIMALRAQQFWQSTWQGIGTFPKIFAFLWHLLELACPEWPLFSLLMVYDH